MGPVAQDFENQITAIKALTKQRGQLYVDIKSGNLHRQLGGYPSNNHRMPVGCEVMKRMMCPGDLILKTPPSGQGATLVIRYFV